MPAGLCTLRRPKRAPARPRQPTYWVSSRLLIPSSSAVITTSRLEPGLLGAPKASSTVVADDNTLDIRHPVS